MLYADMCIESEARGPIVGYLGCSKKCYMSEGSTCSNNYCLCQKQEVGSFRHCCDTCIGPLCYCPQNCDMCGWVLVSIEDFIIYEWNEFFFLINWWWLIRWELN
jgi:hypothetical protein